jgi:hypothetical protein
MSKHPQYSHNQERDLNVVIKRLDKLTQRINNGDFLKCLSMAKLHLIKALQIKRRKKKSLETKEAVLNEYRTGRLIKRICISQHVSHGYVRKVAREADLYRNEGWRYKRKTIPATLVPR